MGTIRYVFQGVGAGSVKSQIKDIDQASSRAAANEDKRAKKLRRNRARNRLKRIRDSKRAAQQEANAAEQAAKVTGRAEEKAARDTERRQRKLRRNRARNRLKRIRETERMAQREARAQNRAQLQSRERRGRIAGGIARGALGLAGGAVLAGVGAVGAVATTAARQQIGLEEKARGLAIQARGAGEKLKDPRKIVADAQAVALEVGGTTAESVLAGMEAFVTKTGRFDLAKSMAGTFATVARATGAETEDIANAAADLMEKFDITSIDDMREALAALTFQGKKGAFELKDAAAQFPKLAAAASRLGIGTGVGAVKQLGGLTQIARQATGSPEAAATALEAVFTGLTTQQKALGQAGVQVFDKEGKARDIQTLLVDVITKVGGTDIAKKKGELAKIFGRQGIRALSPLIAAYANATGDAAEKTKAVADALTNAIDAPGTWADVVEDSALQNETASAKLTTAWEQIVTASGSTLTPAILDLAQTLTTALTEGGGLEAIATAFDILAVNAQTLGDVIGGVADFLISRNLIAGPSSQKTIATEQAAQAKLETRIQGKIDAKEAVFAKSRRGGDLTEKDLAILSTADKEIEGLIGQRTASEQREKAARGKQEAPFAAATVEGKATSEIFFTREEFAKQFAAAAGAKSNLEAAAGVALTGGLLGPGMDERKLSAAGQIADELARGETVPTLGFTETQQQLISQLGGQVQALGQGIGTDMAPSGALGLSAETQAGKLSALGKAADAAAGKLKAIPAPGAGDID